MGLFSSKKKVYVSSTVYNLAGDIEDRVKFLPTTVMSYILKANSNLTLADTIVSSLINGPGIRFRSFGRWARTSGYSDFIGQDFGSIMTSDEIDTSVIAATIEHTSDQSVAIQTADIDAADYSYWADQWMLENHPDEVDGDYTIDINTAGTIIYVTFADGHQYTFRPVNYDPNSQYLYASYNIQSGNQPGEVEEGGEIIVNSALQFPSTSGWDSVSSTSTPGSATLNTVTTTTVSYSDGHPDETTTDTDTDSASWTDTEKVYQKDTYQGKKTNSESYYSDRTIQHNFVRHSVLTKTETDTDTDDIGGGVKKTTTTTTDTDYVKTTYSYRQDSQEIVTTSFSPMKVLIYKQGSGNATLDALFDTHIGSSTYFPFIPIYINNAFVTGEIVERNTKALKKGMNASYEKIVNSLKANSSLGDIDYAYIMFGVPLNTQEPESRKYLFKFFEGMLGMGVGGTAEYSAWMVSWTKANASKKTWLAWKAAQSDPTSPIYGTAAPALIPYPKAPYYLMTLAGTKYGMYIRILWNALGKITGTGLAKSDAKVGDCWVTNGTTQDYEELLYSAGLTDSRPGTLNYMTITWQKTATEYEAMGIWGLVHDNRIYKSKAVTQYGYQALEDDDESGFIIPLNEAIYKDLSLLNATQMATSMAYMVLNSYKVVKQKWYASSWFKIVLIVIVIVVTVVTGGAGGASAGVLGTAASVGAALGFAGITAIIVGTIANAIAAMIISQIISAAATALLGDKIGPIVGAIASVVAISVGTSMANGGGVAGGFAALSSAPNLMKLTVAAGKGLSEYLNAEAVGTVKDTQELIESYESQMKVITQAWKENLGFGKTVIDAMDLTDFGKGEDTYVTETAAMFLGRTLMTGSDIAETTNSMLTNFVTITTSTDLPT